MPNSVRVMESKTAEQTAAEAVVAVDMPATLIWTVKLIYSVELTLVSK